MRFTVRIACAVFICIGFVQRVAAAEPAVGIVGIVSDSAGTPLPSVQVVLAPLNRGTTTDAAGHFSFRNVPAGRYHVEAVLIGYAPAHAEITVPAEGRDVSVRLTMRLTPLTLAGIQVTATPLATDPLKVTQPTTELSAEALARNVGSNVAQTLSGQPGLTTRYNGPAATTPVIRGLSGERILVLQDGQRTSDLSAAAQDHSLSVDPLEASRIEVVRGPASLLYGNNALGGVVNVISNDIPTQIPQHMDGSLSLQAESATPGGAFSGGVTAPLGAKAALLVRAGGRRTNDQHIGGGGTLPNTFFHNFNALAGLGLVTGKVTGGVAYRGYDFDYGLPFDASADDEGGVHIDGDRHEAIAKFDLGLGGGHFTDVRLDGTAQFYRHDEIESSGDVGTRFTLRTQTANLTARTKYGAVTGALGVMGLLKQYGAQGEEALTPGANTRNAGVFVFEDIPLRSGDNAPHLQLGGRFDAYTIDSEDAPRFGPARSRSWTNGSASVGFNVPIGSVASFSVSAARAFRAPTVEELFSNGFHAAQASYDIGNADLRPETNQGLDGVLRVQSHRSSVQLSGYINRIDNYITPILERDTILDDGAVVPLNIYTQGDATMRGIEAQAETEIFKHVVLGVMADAVRGRFADSDSPLPYMPAARIGANARLDKGHYTFSAEVRHAFEQSDVAANEFVAGAYTLLNLSAGFNLIARGLVHSVTLRADNVTDERYREATSRIKEFAFNPGRNLSIVYKVLF